MFLRVRRAHPLSLAIPPLVVALIGWIAARKVFELEWVQGLEAATRGLVTGNLLLALGGTALVVLIVVLLGRIEADDVGLDRDYLGRAIGVIAMIWGASQVIGVLPRVVANRPVLLSPEFEYGSRWAMGGEFLAALGSATLEEVVFRGFLLVQLYLLLTRSRPNPSRAIRIATVVTVIVGNLAALPRTLPYPSLELAVTDQALLLLGGLFACWLYVRTRNLFLVIGVHALLVAPSPVVAGPGPGAFWFQSLVIAALATGWALLWPRD